MFRRFAPRFLLCSIKAPAIAAHVSPAIETACADFRKHMTAELETNERSAALSEATALRILHDSVDAAVCSLRIKLAALGAKRAAFLKHREIIGRHHCCRSLDQAMKALPDLLARACDVILKRPFHFVSDDVER